MWPKYQFRRLVFQANDTMAPSATMVTDLSSRKREGKAVSEANGISAAEQQEIETKYRDFFWTYTEEPHRTRRLAIIKAHPEVHFPLPSQNVYNHPSGASID